MDDSEKFRKASYDAFDKKSRDAVRNWIDSQGLFSLSYEDYGADIKVMRSVGGVFKITRHELEHREPWGDSSKPFPYHTVSIPLRKEKLFATGVDDLYFWTISNDYKVGMFVCANIVCNPRRCAVLRKGTTRGDGDFFSVPLEYYKVVTLA